MVMIKLLIFTGLRNAELAGIRLQDVDLDHCQVRVVQGKGGRTEACCFRTASEANSGKYIHGPRERRAGFLFESTGCGLTPPCAFGRSSMNMPLPLESTGESTRISSATKSLRFSPEGGSSAQNCNCSAVMLRKRVWRSIATWLW